MWAQWILQNFPTDFLEIIMKNQWYQHEIHSVWDF